VALAARAGTSRPAVACWGQGRRGGWHLRAAWRAAIGGEPEAEAVGRIVWGWWWSESKIFERERYCVACAQGEREINC
jgi:hypothetical protein